MVLAGHGTHVPEIELETQIAVETRGTPIDKLERLALSYGLMAEIQDVAIVRRRVSMARPVCDNCGDQSICPFLEV